MAAASSGGTLSMAEILAIQADCLADDIPIDAAMRKWRSEDVVAFFESGGTRYPEDEGATLVEHKEVVNGLLARLRDCMPNALVPDISLEGAERQATDAVVDVTPADAVSAVDAGRIFCVSDLHVDHGPNMAWCRALGERGGFERDVLIIAGDVTSSLVLLQEALELLAATFRKVFYTPGNHDLWVKGKAAAGGVHIRRKAINSLDKLDEIFGLCAKLQVETAPAYAAGAIVVPLLAWYHASWDTQPEIVGWEGIPKADGLLMDFHLCEWPPRLEQGASKLGVGEELARHFDSLNDQTWKGSWNGTSQSTNPAGTNRAASAGGGGGSDSTLIARVRALREAHPTAPVISCSHFVPREEVSPEKRFLFFPPLAKASGSIFLQRRIEQIQPAVHVFGHTHFGWDATHDGVRYLQAPLSYPEERRHRLGTVCTGRAFPHGEPPSPLLVYDATCRRYPPRYDAGWSNWYVKYPRRPDLCHLVPPYVAQQYQRVAGVGEVGWLSANDNPSSSRDGTPTPAWACGPANAVTVEVNYRAQHGVGTR